MKTLKKTSLITGLACFAATSFVAAGICLGVGSLNAQAETGSENAVQATMIEGADIRTDTTVEKMGIRFGYTMSGEDYTNLINSVGEGKTYKSVIFGMLIAPDAYQTNYGELNEENVFGVTPKYDWGTYNANTGEWDYAGTNGQNNSPVRIINVYDDAMKEEADGSRAFYGSMVDVQADSLRISFVGVGYVKYTLADDTVDYYFLEPNDNARTTAYVAQCAIEAGKDSEDVIYNAYLKGLVDSGATAKYTVEKYVQGEDDNYTMTSEQLEATVNTGISYNPENIDGYYLDDAQGNLSGVVYENGSLVLKAYYNKFAKLNDNTQYVVEVAGGKGIEIPFASEYGEVTSVKDNNGNDVNFSYSDGKVVIGADLAYGDYELTLVSKKASLTATNVHSVTKLYYSNDFNRSGADGSEEFNGKSWFEDHYTWWANGHGECVVGLGEDIVLDATTWSARVSNVYGDAWEHHIFGFDYFNQELNGLGHSITINYTEETHNALLEKYNASQSTALTAAQMRIGCMFIGLNGSAYIHDVKFNLNSIAPNLDFQGYLFGKVEGSARIENCVFDVNINATSSWNTAHWGDNWVMLSGVVRTLLGSVKDCMFISRGNTNINVCASSNGTAGGKVENCVVIAKNASPVDWNFDEGWSNPYGSGIEVKDAWQFTSLANAATGTLTDGYDGYYATNTNAPSDEGIKTVSEVLSDSAYLTVVEGKVLWNGVQLEEIK